MTEKKAFEAKVRALAFWKTFYFILLMPVLIISAFLFPRQPWIAGVICILFGLVGVGVAFSQKDFIKSPGILISTIIIIALPTFLAGVVILFPNRDFGPLFAVLMTIFLINLAFRIISRVRSQTRNKNKGGGDEPG